MPCHVHVQFFITRDLVLSQVRFANVGNAPQLCFAVKVRVPLECAAKRDEQSRGASSVGARANSASAVPFHAVIFVSAGGTSGLNIGVP